MRRPKPYLAGLRKPIPSLKLTALFALLLTTACQSSTTPTTQYLKPEAPASCLAICPTIPDMPDGKEETLLNDDVNTHLVLSDCRQRQQCLAALLK